MKWILGAILIILAIGFLGMLLPAIKGIAAGIALIRSGSIIGGLIAMIAGIGINVAMLYGGYAEGSSGGGYSHADDECPYCGSGDTDGNHCYTCDDDF